MQENFWNDNYHDFREKEIFENCKRTCAFFVSLVTTIGIFAILSYLATPLIGKLKYQAEIDWAILFSKSLKFIPIIFSQK